MAEADALRSGRTIHNTTDHYRNGKGGSVSRGFCLTDEAPRAAWRRLKGIVTAEVCCEYDIPSAELCESFGRYHDHDRHQPCLKREWCTTVLRPEWLRAVTPIEDIATKDELLALRICAMLGIVTL